MLTAALVAVFALGACGSDDDDGSAASTTSTSPSTTVAPDTCALDGASTDARTGDASLLGGRPAALLRNVQVQASACVDAIVLSFAGGVPGHRVEYVAPPFTADPSGLPVEVAGDAFLQVRLEPASGVDLTADTPVRTYDGPATITPTAPAGVREVRQLGDFEAVTSWVIGLDERRPFTITAAGDAIVISIQAPEPRATTCETDGVTVDYRDDWFAELAAPWACQLLDPALFVVHPATDDTTWQVRVSSSTTSFADEVARWGESAASRVTSSEAATVDGHDARVIDATSTGEGMLPAGLRLHAYIVDRGDDGSVVVSATPAAPSAAFDATIAAVDEVAASLRIGPAPARCSASGMTADVPDDAGLSPAAAAMRADLVQAAVTCDYDALGALADRNGLGVRFSFGDDTDAIGAWRAQEAAGEGVLPLRALRLLLGLPHGTMPSGDGSVQYVWPAAFAEEHPTDAQLEEIAATGLYDMATMRSWIADGMNYLGYRVLVTADGDWTLFVAGD